MPDGQPRIEIDDVLDVNEVLLAKAVTEDRAMKAAEKLSKRGGKVGA